MSNINKQSVQAVADLKAGYTLGHADVEIIQQMALDAVTLLDELEAKDNRINRLEAIVAVAEQRNAMMREWKRALKVPCDLVDNQVPVVIHGMVIRLERIKETEDKLTAAEKRIAELQNDEVRQRLANAEHQLHMAELAKHNLRASRKAQFRKRKVAERRIAELEAREVKLPERYDIEMCPMPSPDGDWYSREDVLAALVVAGVKFTDGTSEGE